MRELFKPALSLMILCLAVGLSLSFTNSITKDKIALRNEEASSTERFSAIPEADDFKEMKNWKTKLDNALSKIEGTKGNKGNKNNTNNKDSEYSQIDFSIVDSVYTAYKNNKLSGYVVKTVPKGYAGIVPVTVGINIDQITTGIVVGENKETPGLGSKAADISFSRQFTGSNLKQGLTTVVKVKSGNKAEIQAISGATITSKAVSRGVNTALYLVNLIQQESEE